jgi:uncharacterized Zn finger protein
VPERPNRTFRRTFSQRELQSLAGRRAFERGQGYALDGRVHKMAAAGEQVDAKVRGSASYQVRLWIEDEEAAWACTCPVGREERFCKHAVAVGLLATGSVEPEHGDGNTDEVSLAVYLADLDHQALVDLLLERAAADGLFDARLRAAAASKSGGRPDLTRTGWHSPRRSRPMATSTTERRTTTRPASGQCSTSWSFSSTRGIPRT